MTFRDSSKTMDGEQYYKNFGTPRMNNLCLHCRKRYGEHIANKCPI